MSAANDLKNAQGGDVVDAIDGVINLASRSLSNICHAWKVDSGPLTVDDKSRGESF